ncbi:MAG: thioredoxin [Bacteroidetes bacterium]|nr:thioredoxin [Bacteroidales bacterium]NJO70119.1 thioredoxin [Bacteroidota bacterium]
MKGTFEDIVNSAKPVLIDFFAEWCGPCKAQSPVLKEVATELGEKVKVIKIDVDKNPEIAMKYNIQGVPTIMVFKAGKQLFRQSGMMSKSQIYNVLINSIN